MNLNFRHRHVNNETKKSSENIAKMRKESETRISELQKKRKERRSKHLGFKK